MIGVERYKVSLVPHDENWADEYEITRNEVKTILGDNVIEINHVGSTAIKGIAAKPILDVAVVVKSVESLNISGMEEAGYEYCGCRMDTGKHLFVRRAHGYISTHHIACYLKNNDDYNSSVIFCRYLNENPEYAKQYNDLKIELASQYPDDRIAYADAKGDFIENILILAKGSVHAENVFKRNLNIITQIISYCEDISNAVARFGDSCDMLANNNHYKNAVSMCVLQIGRLSLRLTQDFKEKFNGISWYEIKAVYNAITHDYESVKMDILWQIISEYIPALCKYCGKILRENLV